MDVKLKILVVEDDVLAQMVAKTLLQDSGYQADIAGSGDEAIQNAIHSQYALILMDIGLGNTDGFAVAKTIKMSDTKNQNTPIIALTAHHTEEYENKAKEVGMVGFFTKPLERDTLMELVEKYISC